MPVRTSRQRGLSGARAAWVEPGPQEVADGVYRIPLPLPLDALRAVNVYALRTDEGLTLIDGGWALAESHDELTRALERLGRRPAEIRHCLVTHAHRDHYTQAVALRRTVGTRVSIGIGERANLEQVLRWSEQPGADDHLRHLRRSGALELLEALRGRAGATARADWELPDSWLTGEQQVSAGGRRLSVIETPGHTRGHVVFHDEAAGLLFAGDHVLPHITPSIGFEPVRADFPLRDYLNSLLLVLQRPDAQLLPAHGPVAPSAHARVRELLAHHDARLAETEAAARAGAATAFETAQALGWTRHHRTFAELDLFNQMLAVSETAAHLDVLVLQGRLTSSTDQDGIELYQ